MKIVIKSAFDLTKSAVFDGDLEIDTIFHNKESIRSLAGVGAVDDQGTYRDVKVTVTKAKKSEYPVIVSILSGTFHLSTENFRNFYNVDSYVKNFPMESEGEFYYKSSFDFGTKMRRKT